MALVAQRVPDARRPAGQLVRLAPTASDEELLEGARAQEAWARAALLDRYGALVERLVRRVLGHGPDLEDRVHDAFVAVLRSLDEVRDVSRLRAWIATVAVHTAHRAIRRRKLERTIFFWRSSDIDHKSHDHASHDATPERQALRRVYELLEQLAAAERVAFVLHHIEEMSVEEAARVCTTPLTTFKRRLARAERRFFAMARGDELLRPWSKEEAR